MSDSETSGPPISKRRAGPGGRRHIGKLKSVNSLLLANKITAEEAEAIPSFLGYYRVDIATNQLVPVPLSTPVSPPSPVDPPVSTASSSTEPLQVKAPGVPPSSYLAQVYPWPAPAAGIPRGLRPSGSILQTTHGSSVAAKTRPGTSPIPRPPTDVHHDALRPVPALVVPASSPVNALYNSRREAGRIQIYEHKNQELIAQITSQYGAELRRDRAFELPLKIAFDLHNTLDDGSKEGTIPPTSRTAVQHATTIGGGSTVYVCSYIGRSLDRSQWHQDRSAALRESAAKLVSEFAKKVGLTFHTRERHGPSPDSLFFVISNRKTFSPGRKQQGYLNGKVSVLTRYRTPILVDDAIDICEEVSDYGILPYHICGASSIRFNHKALYEEGFADHSFVDVKAAVKQIEADYVSGVLDSKLRALQRVSKPYIVPNEPGL